jgi:ketosteroid isomerase-like protein
MELALSDNELVEQAKTVIANHEDNCRRCDLEAVLINVSDDVVVLASEAPLIEGRAAFENFYRDLLDMGCWDFLHHYSGTDVVGGAVILRGVSRGTFTSKHGDSEPIDNNFLLTLRQENGVFKIWRGAFAPASAAG